MSTLPSILALFLTHFDDIKGQTIIYFQSDGIGQTNIEHISLPSGLHLLEHDLVTFTHEGRPGVGLFRNRTVEGGRGRRMGTIGVIPTSDLPEDLFSLQSALETIYDELETLDNPFNIEQSRNILDRVWNEAKSQKQNEGKGDRAAAVRALAEGRGNVTPEHPIAYLPSLLAILGPLIIPVYKAALTGKRILIYSQPPLLPVSAFAWCIAAMALAPATIGGVGIWLGNVGLMDLAGLKERKSGWVATTSDAIYRSHAVYDLFLDLSTTPPTISLPPTSSSSKPQSITYHLSDLPLYRSLLMLDSSPSSISITQPSSSSSSSTGTNRSRNIYSGQGGWWLLAFDIFSSFWALCVGVCEYAVGRGRIGDIHLEEGEEDARLLPRDLEDIEDEGIPDGSSPLQQQEEDGAVRRGRLILRQLYHSTYHLHARLVQVVVNGRRGRQIGDKEVKELTGTKLFVSAEEVKFWRDLARYWDLVVEPEQDE